MKLAILTHYWESTRGGGINSYVTGLVSKLNDISNNIEIKIIFSDGYDNDNYKIHRGRITWILGSISALRKIKPDVIHVHESWPLLLGGAIYRTLRRNVRLVYTFLTEPEKPVRFVKKINKRLKKYPYQWALNQCDYVTFATKDQERKCEELYDFTIKSKKALIYPGVEPKEVLEEEKKEFCEKFSICGESIILLAQAFTATKLKSEGAKLLMESVKQVRCKYPNIILILTREGKYSNELKEFAEREGCHKNVIFTGDITNPFIPLAICDVFIWPWLGEIGMGMALLEAMSMEKPIIATSLGATLEPLINGKNGLLVEPNIDDIANGIVKLLENKELANELGMNARKTALERFTWEECAERYLNLYRVII